MTNSGPACGATVFLDLEVKAAPGTRTDGDSGTIAAGDEETTVIKGLGVQRLVALFFGGMVLFNFPLLALWDRDLTLFGLPLFPAALFVGWGVLIAVVGWTVERIDR